MTIPARGNWRTNGEMMADVRQLYIGDDDLVLDATFGESGGFWTKWRPEKLTAHDLKVDGVDYRELPEPDGRFDVSVIDPPYKLVGRPSLPPLDQRYALDQYRPWQVVIADMCEGFTECHRVTRRGGLVMVKCQDQVCSGAIRWQTDDLSLTARGLRMDKVDRFDMPHLGPPQPAGRSQVHAQKRGSTLLVFRKRYDR